MEKIKFKFILAIIFLIGTSYCVFFHEDFVVKIDNYIIPLIFVYFLVDISTVLFPVLNDTIYSGKLFEKYYKEQQNYNKQILDKLIKSNNKRAFLALILYFLIMISTGMMYKLNYIRLPHFYIILVFINFLDYFFILIWCPLRSWIMKNKCCNTCRISNWDRFMKFFLLIFLPFDGYLKVLTLLLLSFGVFILLQWEYTHHKHPERFYPISNQTLRCPNCDIFNCKEHNIQKNT